MTKTEYLIQRHHRRPQVANLVAVIEPVVPIVPPALREELQPSLEPLEPELRVPPQRGLVLPGLLVLLVPHP